MSGRKGWIYTSDGRVLEKGSPEHMELLESRAGPMIAPDEGDFVSPIDGKTYSGRAGMREHNKLHDVVNNRDLVGLPYRKFGGDTQPPDRKAIRSAIIEAGKRLGHL